MNLFRVGDIVRFGKIGTTEKTGLIKNIKPALNGHVLMTIDQNYEGSVEYLSGPREWKVLDYEAELPLHI